MGKQSVPPVKATRTSFQIIQSLREMDSAGVTELADHLEMPKSTVHDHLQTLEQGEYVVKSSGQYRIGVKFLELGGHQRKQMKIFRIAKPEIQNLASETGQHANLMIEENGMGVFLHTAKGDDAVQLDTYAGRRVHLQTTALGKSILARLPRERVEEILDQRGMPQITKRTVSDREELFEELDTIRDRGIAVDDGERVRGMRCVAAPILGPDDEVAAAVSVSGPKSEFRDEQFEYELPDRVRRTANVIEVNFTYQ